MAYLKILALSCMLFFAFKSEAQTANVLSSAIRWNIDQLTDVLSDTTESHSCAFVTHKKNKIDWIQKNGETVLSFSVVKVTGVWTDVSADGEVTYSVKLNGNPGKITIRRAGDILNLLLELRGLEDGDIVNRYRISHLEVID